MNKITVFTCGGSKGNPGPAAIGIYVVDSEGKVLIESAETIGNATDDYAEYFAIVRGLQVVADLFGGKTKETKFELKISNETVNKQLNAEHQINDVSLIGHFIEIFNIRVAYFPNLMITYIGKGSNKEANRLVKEALDS